MLNILSHTPVWVFVLFAALLCLGLLQTRDREVPALRAFVLPTAMLGLSLFSVRSHFGWAAAPWAAWCAGLVVVAFGARRVHLTAGVSFDLRQRRFVISGSWVPLAVIMCIFCTKYAVAVLQARMGAPLGVGAAVGLGLWWGACSGFFAARLLALWARMHQAREVPRSRSSGGAGDRP